LISKGTTDSSGNITDAAITKHIEEQCKEPPDGNLKTYVEMLNHFFFIKNRHDYRLHDYLLLFDTFPK